MNILDYVFKANLYGLLFAGCYFLLLRRHTFLKLNRTYILASAVLTLTLPLVSLTPEETSVLPVPPGVLTLPIAPIATIEPTPVTGVADPDWTTLAGPAYGLVVLLLLGWLGIRIGRIGHLIRQSERRPQADFTLVIPATDRIATFSFFHYVILNPADAGNALILQHERIHVRQWHSADVLGLAVLRAVFWPVLTLWLLDRALRQVHEFLADRATVDRQATQPQQYAQFLVDYAFGIQPDALTNGFINPTLLKQRIQMLQRRATTRWALGKYVLLLPLLPALVAMTSVPDQLTSTMDRVIDETITVKGRITSAVDGRALPGASVMDGNRLATTDKNGLYTLTGVRRNAKLTFSSLGYRTDQWQVDALTAKMTKNVLSLSPRLQPTLENELPAMGATAAYKTVKPNPAMPLNAVPTSVVKDGRTYNSVAEPATFPTGIPGLMNYVAHSLRYPAKAKAAGIEGDVYVLFTVSPSGKVTDARVNKTIASPGGGCQEEAVRVVSQMPNWIPATQQGRPVSVRYQIPIRFALEHTSKTRKTPAPADTLPETGKAWRPGRDYPDYSTNKDRYSLPLPDSLRLLTPPSATVRISTLSKGDPLFVVDGIALEKDNIRGMINPNNIESITVLKDGAATTTYGEKGKNGVIFIKTKKP